jgi:hypothetical protein
MIIACAVASLVAAACGSQSPGPPSLRARLSSVPVARTDAAFISFNIDAAEVLMDRDKKRAPFPWSSPLLAARARHLAPMKLRIGGGDQSRVSYDDTFFTQELPKITSMARSMNASLVWGTKPDLKSAAALLQSPAAADIAEYEYGNEPSSDAPPSKATQLAGDFLQFHRLMQTHRPGVPLIGPDVGYGAWHSSCVPCCAARLLCRRRRRAG